MTQEEKQLLVKDLCARLPYNPKVKYKHYHKNGDDEDIVLNVYNAHKLLVGMDIYHVKPYLRPMSSMTNEENTWADADYSYNKLTYGIDYAIVCYVDYLYSIHVDCHGLIPKGLALEAPEGMYDTNSKEEGGEQ